MQRFFRYGVVPAALAAFVLLAVSLGQRRAGLPSAPPLDDWDIPELAAQLNRAGLEVRMEAVPKNGVIGPSAFLISAEKDWDDLNSLSKDPRRISEWRGIVYCERVGRSDSSALARQWGGRCLDAGPFLFYGDAGLLARVRAALNLSASETP